MGKGWREVWGVFDGMLMGGSQKAHGWLAGGWSVVAGWLAGGWRVVGGGSGGLVGVVVGGALNCVLGGGGSREVVE